MQSQSPNVSQQFLAYIKDTSNISNKKPEQKPAKSSIKQKLHDNRSYGPVEGDFNKICSTYVLENNKLMKKGQVYCKEQKKEQIGENFTQDVDQHQSIELIKERAKLQYLEKKGYLKPDEVKRLQILKNKKIAQLTIPQEQNNAKQSAMTQKVQLVKPINKVNNIQNKMHPHPQYHQQMMQDQLVPQAFYQNSQNMDPNYYSQVSQKGMKPFYNSQSKGHSNYYNKQIQFDHQGNYPQQQQYYPQGQYHPQGQFVNEKQYNQQPYFEHRGQQYCEEQYHQEEYYQNQ